MDHQKFINLVKSAQDIEKQSLSFCQNGALGINYYGWDDGTVSNIQTAANNAQIKR